MIALLLQEISNTIHQWYKLTSPHLRLHITYLNWQHTTERGSVEEVLAVEEKQEGLDVFWEPRSRVAGGGEETVLFSVWISLWGGEKETGVESQQKLHNSY